MYIGSQCIIKTYFLFTTSSHKTFNADSLCIRYVMEALGNIMEMLK